MWRDFDVENHCFCSLHQIPHSAIYPKKKLFINFSRYWNSSSSSAIITGFFSIKVSIKSFLLVRSFSMGLLSILFFASEYWQSGVPNNVTLVVLSWNFFLRNYTLVIFHLGVYWKTWTGGEKTINKSLSFPRIKILIFRDFQNMVVLLIYLGLRSHLCP